MIASSVLLRHWLRWNHSIVVGIIAIILPRILFCPWITKATAVVITRLWIHCRHTTTIAAAAAAATITRIYHHRHYWVIHGECHRNLHCCHLRHHHLIDVMVNFHAVDLMQWDKLRWRAVIKQWWVTSSKQHVKTKRRMVIMIKEKESRIGIHLTRQINMLFDFGNDSIGGFYMCNECVV